MIKVFISSRMTGELDLERRVALETIQELAKRHRVDMSAVTFEHQPAPPSTTTAGASLQWVAESDVFIGIYYRTISPIVRDEFYAAQRRNIPTFLFVKSLDPAALTTGEAVAYSELRDFLSGKDSAYVYKQFTGADLALHVASCLLEYIPRRFMFPRLDEKYVLSTADLARLENLSRKYVPPVSFDTFKLHLLRERLVIISGPPHTGKTSLGLMLCLTLQDLGIIRRIVLFPADGGLSDLKDLADSAVFLDDPFGAVRFTRFVQPAVDQAEALVKLKEHNYIIMASRADVLHEAFRNSKFGELSAFRSVMKLDETAYTPLDRCRILRAHLRLSGASKRLIGYAAAHEDLIVAALQFPHSYQILPQLLEDACTGKRQLAAVLEDANEIEGVVSAFFSRFYQNDKEVFYFLLCLALVNNQARADFAQAHRLCVQSIVEYRRLAVGLPTIHDLDRLSLEAVPYVSADRTVAYSHPSYWQGVFRSIKSNFLGDALRCIALLGTSGLSVLREAVFSPLVEICSTHLDEALPDVLPVIMSLVQDDWRRDGRAAAFLAACAADRPIKTIDLILELLGSSNHYVARDSERALEVAALHAPETTLPIVIGLARSESSVRLRAVHVLGRVAHDNPIQVLPILDALAKDEDWQVRRQVALSFNPPRGELPADIATLLRALTKDPHWMVSAAAEASLRRNEAWPFDTC